MSPLSSLSGFGRVVPSGQPTALEPSPSGSHEPPESSAPASSPPPVDCPYAEVYVVGKDGEPRSRCKLISKFAGWKHGMPITICEQCIADLLSPRSLGSLVARRMVNLILRVRVASNYEWTAQQQRGEVARTMDETFTQLLKLTSKETAVAVLAKAITNGMSVQRAERLAADNGISMDEEV